jgi:hypothetical protein
LKTCRMQLAMLIREPPGGMTAAGTPLIDMRPYAVTAWLDGSVPEGRGLANAEQAAAAEQLLSGSTRS